MSEQFAILFLMLSRSFLQLFFIEAINQGKNDRPARPFRYPDMHRRGL
jgi:hypothetical protein